MNYAAIPGKLDFDLRYTISAGVDEQHLLTAAPNFGGPPSPTNPATICGNGFTAVLRTPCQGAFPDNKTMLERLDAVATYKFDPIWVRSMGFNGDLKAKLRYTWERNSVSNWANDPLAPFTPTVGSSPGSFLWMAYNNPNYNVHMLAGSLIATW
jgi:hypothetical protein